jgi:hypothetical protein
MPEVGEETVEGASGPFVALVAEGIEVFFDEIAVASLTNGGGLTTPALNGAKPVVIELFPSPLLALVLLSAVIN